MPVRPATAADLPEVLRLAQLMYASMGQHCDAGWRTAAGQAYAARLGSELAVFVVDADRPGRLGACGAGTVASRLPGPANPTGRVGYVQWICTEPALRRAGLARSVLRALLEWYDAALVPVVELHATRDGASLYRSLGFNDAGPVALRRHPATAHPG